ncbi:FliM/FliN family flagellar motor C-terminal domain-containing protein [Aliiroseovarius sp. S2029]|uniref:flagellar motor switch protein FliM n=1 Tax=Aliiroseovarius sp. S2029 TaxID=2936988 RepID=UPI0020BFFA13|nr:FliM/FliN family flagellar motor C-terminal domain-containing protein [Aliiroseovarius sp. S2029]MCK8482884.1 FliM/FliN family flagellar motor C-terminal domain-containing protein [Aliiroseovarius sp. S2029]
MADPVQISALRQKAGAGRPPPEIPPVTAAGALGKALARAGDATAGLAIAATDVTEDRVVLSAAGKAVGEHDLLAIAEGADSRFGLLIADPDLVAAVIEMQTVGRVLPTPAQARAPTRTDAAMCADFFDEVLEQLENALSAARLPIAGLCSGYRFALQLDDYRAATMTLPEIAYRRFQAVLDLGDGGKKGRLTLLLPFTARQPNDAPQTDGVQKPATEAPPVMLGARVDLRAVLHRCRMSLDEVTGLVPGVTIALTREVLDRVQLEDLTGQVHATCRLGQAAGQRALRIGLDLPGQEGRPQMADPVAPHDQVAGVLPGGASHGETDPRQGKQTADNSA